MHLLLRRACRSAWALPPALPRRSCTRWYASAPASARNADPAAVAVVIGASRGIGLAATQALMRRFTGTIVALCRDPDSANALKALVQFDPRRLRVAPIDVTDEASVATAAAAVRELGEERVDLVFNTAGLLHDCARMPETSLSKVDPSFLRLNFEVRAPSIN